VPVVDDAKATFATLKVAKVAFATRAARRSEAESVKASLRDSGSLKEAFTDKSAEIRKSGKH